MKAVSIHQPWAWAILHAGKNVENRTWRTHHRGPLLIHAALSRKSHDRQDAARWPDLYGVELPGWVKLTTGAIIGIVEVVDCVKVGRGGDLVERGRSPWALAGYFGWVLANPRAFAEPIPYAGAQMFFEVTDELLPLTSPSTPGATDARDTRNRHSA